MRWAMKGVFLSAALMVPIAGCDLFGDECATPGDEWCDGNVLKSCEADEGSLGTNYRVESHPCSAEEECIDWPVGRTFSDATCLPSDVCSTSTSFCVNGDIFDSIAACAGDGRMPSMNNCGDENFEGDECVVATTGATCGFKEEACGPEGAEMCWKERYFLVCAGGFWTGLDACLIGEECVLSDDGEVDCILREKGQ